MLVEKASIEDAEEILALQKAAYASEGRFYNDLSIPPLTQTLEEMRTDFERQLVLKAVEEGEIVGSVRARMKEGRCLIGRLIVRPDRQGRGIGSRLMEEIEASFPQAESFRLFTGHRSEKPLHIYEKMGYEEYRTEYLHEDLTLIYLEKSNPETSLPV
jgi:ribosomal protein S18 acetylase RimI-like enzyme